MQFYRLILLEILSTHEKKTSEKYEHGRERLQKTVSEYMCKNEAIRAKL